MNREAKQLYLKAVKKRYINSRKRVKSQILKEFCLICGYSRKYAIRLLNRDEANGNATDYKKAKRGPGAPRKYSEQAREKLKDYWKFLRKPCSLNLKYALEIWTNYDEINSEKIKKEIISMSPSTIERILKEEKNKKLKGLSGTKPSKYKSQIPIKLCKSDDKKSIGKFEADTVAHCGDSLFGKFAWTLTMTDLHSGWTENRACFTKSAEEVKNAVFNIERKLPFPILGFSSDNGTEFLNKTLQTYLKQRGSEVIEITRGRPYKKNDNAHVEQKNFTHVRELFGYERIDEPLLISLMNEIYIDYWNPLKNFFTPSLRLERKERIGSKIVKKYGKPKTPYQRVLDSHQLNVKEESELVERKQELNPFILQNNLNKKLKEFFILLKRNREIVKKAA